MRKVTSFFMSFMLILVLSLHGQEQASESFSEILSTNEAPDPGVSPPESFRVRTNTVYIRSITVITQARIPDVILPDKPSLWRACVPGAGQFQLGERTKGIILAGFFAVSGVCAAGLYLDAYGLKEKSVAMAVEAEKILEHQARHTAMSNAQNLWEQAQGEEGAGLALICVTAAIWAYSAFDYVYSFQRQKKLEINLRDDKLNIRYRIKL